MKNHLLLPSLLISTFCFAATCFATTCFATTWGESEVDDPFKQGEKCKVHQPASYGGYIYSWPSKYDQVFWPYTDPHSIWFCEKSGYVSFMTNFDELNENDKNKIHIYLDKNQLQNPTQKQLIKALEEIYLLRELAPEKRNMLTRVFARWHQGFGDLDKAKEYRKKTLVEIEVALESELSQYKKMEYLYLAANYTRLFGDIEKSDDYLKRLKIEIETVEDKELSGFSEYLSELSKDTKFIIPGSKIEPTKKSNALE